ncbi:hypothetical protein Gohar_020771 [Gossypium harknessii]|uniref:Uncharacterized protein n=1 Tax=Gossypium harknessii TaxID=34285 RepID=A0A7J9I1G0_9ROSI|nr:hypothetical protein [Gossypium harknessii]
MKRFTVNPMTIPEYDWWWEIIKQDFENKSSKVEKNRTVGRGKYTARIRRRHLEVRS